MEQWIAPAASTVVGGAITAFAAVKVLQSQMRDHNRRLKTLEDEQGGLEEKYVTRREFRMFVDNVHKDLTNISATLTAIRDFLMTEGKDFINRTRGQEK